MNLWNKAIWVKLLYIKFINLLKTRKKITEKFGLIKHNSIRFFKYNPTLDTFIIEIIAKTI